MLGGYLNILVVCWCFWVDVFKMTGSVSKCTEFCLGKRGKVVFKLGSIARVLIIGSKLCVNSVEFTGCLLVCFS